MSASYKIALGIAAALVLVVIVYLTTQNGGETPGDGTDVADNTTPPEPRPSLRSDSSTGPGPAARVTDPGRATGPAATRPGTTSPASGTDTPAPGTTPRPPATPPGPTQITLGDPTATNGNATGANTDLMASIRALRSGSTPPPSTNTTPDNAADTAADTAGIAPGATDSTTGAADTTTPTTDPITPPATANPIRPTTTDTPPITTTTPTPTPRPAPATTTASATPRTYTVEAGDNFFRISEKIYGSDRYWQAIAQANPLVDPARLKIGQELKLPAKAEVVEEELDDIEAPANTVVHTVKAGESLSTIAAQYYKDPTQWNVIYNANRERIGSNPDRLQAGMKLAIPPALPR